MASETELTTEDQYYLLSLARKTLEHLGKRGTAKPPEEDVVTQPIPPALLVPSGVFVSLHKGDSLRGCIGYIQAVKPLWETVQEMAVAAAFHDPRFPSLKADEIQDLTLEVSVLSPLKCIKNIEEIEVGKHGLYIVRGYNCGLLLPQVAVEYGWDRDCFLGEACCKAGLPPHAWKDKETEIYIFSADYFGDTT